MRETVNFVNFTPEERPCGTLRRPSPGRNARALVPTGPRQRDLSVTFRVGGPGQSPLEKPKPRAMLRCNIFA
jgi:hypothetical protein